MKRFLSLLALLLAPLAVHAATVVTNIARFPSVSVAYTNYVGELITTNGITLGGVRNTAWPASLLSEESAIDGWGGNSAALNTNLVLTVKGGFGFYDPNTIGIDGTTNDYYVIWVPGTSDASDPSGGGLGTFVAGDPFVYTPPNCCSGGIVNEQVNRSGPTLSTDSTKAYWLLTVNSLGGIYPETNEVLTAVSQDGYAPFTWCSVSDGYDVQGTTLNGVPVNGFSRFGVNTNTPTATFEVATHYSSKPMLKLSHTDGTTPMQVAYDGLVSSVAGFKSTAVDAAVTIATTGWTNTFGKAATIYINATAGTYVVYDNAGTTVVTNNTVIGHTSTANLQSSGKVIITAGTAITGRAVPW